MDPVNPESPSREFVRQIDVHTILPQQEPFVMIGRLEHFDMKRIETSLEIKEDNIFVEHGAFTAPGLIENIAQTCAARIGYINTYILKTGIRIGFIGAIRNFSVNALPKVGEHIFTSVEIMEEVFGMLLARAETTSDGALIASTEIKIAIKD